jgi:oligoendopeptidase F
MNVSETVKRITELQLCGSDSRAQSYNEGLKAAIHILESCDQPQLNENQQIVLEWLKRENFDSYIKSVLSNLYFYVNMTAIGDLENEEIQEMVNAYEELSQEDFAQVLQAFSTWVLEQEEE